MIQYNKVTKHVKAARRRLEPLMLELEAHFVAARQEPLSIPVYLTKGRIKSAESLYLKMRRRNWTAFSDVTDLLGFRILCLFEQDIDAVHAYLCECFAAGRVGDTETTLNEVRVYSWDAESWGRFKEAVKGAYRTALDEYVWDAASGRISGRNAAGCVEVALKKEGKGSGYRSIHYIVSTEKGKLELQVRTLLQDVWSELDHHLAYKSGRIDPNVRRTIEVLAEDLGASDRLVSALRYARDKEDALRRFLAGRTAPSAYFEHERELEEALFYTDESRGMLNRYRDHLNRGEYSGLGENWLARAEGILEELKQCASTPNDKLHAKNLRYWMACEQAYMRFASGELGKAWQLYKSEEKRAPLTAKYRFLFRRGEIALAEGRTIEALTLFDDSIDALGPVEGDERRNAYFVKTKLAEVYWSLGPDFIRVSVEQIDEAAAVLDEYGDAFGARALQYRMSNLNNLCWYYTEAFFHALERDSRAQAEELLGVAREHYERLAEAITSGGEDTAANFYDTAAWHCYRSYQFAMRKYRDREEDAAFQEASTWLSRAKVWCVGLDSARPNSAASPMASQALQMQHLQEISRAIQGNSIT